MKALRPRWPASLSVEAKTITHEAWPALVMNIFEPLMTYSSPRRTAVVWIPETSEPAFGSVSANEQRIGSSSSGGSHSRCCSSVPAISIGSAPRMLATIDGADPGAAPAELLADQRALDRAEAGAAELLGDVRVHQADLVRLRDHVGRVRLVLVVLGRHRPDLLGSANSCASSRSAFCSSVSAKEIPVPIASAVAISHPVD